MSTSSRYTPDAAPGNERGNAFPGLPRPARRASRDPRSARATHLAGYPRRAATWTWTPEPTVRERVTDALVVGVTALVVLGVGYALVVLALGAL